MRAGLPEEHSAVMADLSRADIGSALWRVRQRTLTHLGKGKTADEALRDGAADVVQTLQGEIAQLELQIRAIRRHVARSAVTTTVQM